MPKVSQRPRQGMPPPRPPAERAQDIDWSNEDERAKSFEGRQQPGVFSPAQFASAGFYLPQQESRDDALQVFVRCWYCGVHVDEWKDGDSLLGEHIRHSRATERVSDASCAYAQFRKQELQWEDGKRVCPRRESSRREKTSNFSNKPSRRRAEHPGSDDEGGEAPSSSSGTVAAPGRSKRTKAPPPPPPPPKPKPKGRAACPRAAKPPPPPPKPAAVLAPPSTPPLSSYAVSLGVVNVIVDLE